MASNPSFSIGRVPYSVNVLGFGADPTGTNDSGPAFAAAVEECRTRNYSTLYIPAGVYKISSFGGGGSGSDQCTSGLVGWCLNRISGLCIRGDGAYRGGNENDNVGTKIVFDLTPAGEPPTPRVGIGIKGCSVLRFENLTIQGAPTLTSTNSVVGVRIETVSGASTTAIQFQNVSFRWCAIAVQTADTLNNSELAFYDCHFNENLIGFQSLNNQALVQKFIGCVGGGNSDDDDYRYFSMEVMFDLVAGGNITIIGFGGQQIKTLVRAGVGGANIGWNTFINVRLEALDPWRQSNRIKLYEATAAGLSQGQQRSTFDGVIIVGLAELDTGRTRFSLLRGHDVVLWNAGRNANEPIATAASPLVEFSRSGSSEVAGGTFRAYAVDVPFDARLERGSVPAGAVYSFQDCEDLGAPYPLRLNPPLYGPNYQMLAESHCWRVADGIVDAVTVASGSVTSIAPPDTSRAGVIECEATDDADVAALAGLTATLKFTGGEWRFQTSIRVTATGSDYILRSGFGDDADAEPANGVYFLYNGSASANWRAILRVASATTNLDTQIPVTTGWHTLEVAVDASGVSTFFIDGALIETVPTPAAPMAAVGLLPLQIIKAGETPTVRTAQIDYYKYEFRPASPGTMYPE